MKDVLIHFKANEIEYPLAFNINVIEIMQDKFGSITNFSNAISPESGEPRMSDIKFIYKECINEGIDMENDPDSQYYKPGEKRNFINEKQAGRLIGSITDSTGTIKQLVVQSNDSGQRIDEDEEEEKNLKTEQ